MKQKKSLKFKIFARIAIFLLILVSGFFIYVSSYYKADSFALESLKSDDLIQVEAKNMLFLITIDLQPFSRIQIAFI